MNDFNKKLKGLILDKLPIERITTELISDLKSHCEEIDKGIFKVYASSRITQEESKEFIIDTNKTLNIIYYNLRVYEIDENNTSVDFFVSWGENPKIDFFEGLEQVCYFEIEYQILKGAEVNYITYDAYYS